LLALGGLDGGICVLTLGAEKLNTQNCGQEVQAFAQKITALYFSTGNRWLFAGSTDGSVKRFDMQNLQKVPDVFPGLDGEVGDIEVSPDGSLAAAAGKAIAIWTLDPHTLAAKACAVAGRPFSAEEIRQYSLESWLSPLLGPSLDEVCSDQRDRLQTQLP